ELDDNDYINDGNKYYIKIRGSEFNKIRKNLDFRETFADIIGSIFNITDIEKYERLISDDIDETEKILKRKYGSEALEEARKYLDMDDEFLAFWKTIYELKGKNFNDKYKIEHIKEELNITTDLSKLDYQDLSGDTSCEVLQKLFEELEINIDDFNKKSSYLKINFTEFHRKNLEKCFNDNYKTFEKILYQWCLDNDKKEKFIDLKGKYENADKVVGNVLDMNYQEFVEKFVEDKFDFSLKDKQSNINFEKIYDENKSKFSEEELKSLNNEYESLLYFEDGYKKIKEKLQQFDQSKENIKTDFADETVPEFYEDIKIEKVEFGSMEPNTMQEYKNYGSYNPHKERKLKEIGDKAERCLYNYLVKRYGRENVIWVSRESDSEHYDMKYKKENEWIYVEVKTFSNDRFFMSKAEKDFADANKDRYELFLVKISSDSKCEEGKIYPVKYSDLEKLEFIPKEFEIHYKLSLIKDREKL
ncbi:protein NO VEIN domain-containing protein, partial [Persephonella sp.]